MLRGLIWQLLGIINLGPHAEKWLEYFKEDGRSRSTVSDPSALWEVLQLLLQTPGLSRVFIVLDGLDECGDESKVFIISKLQSLINNKTRSNTPSSTPLKLVLVSRELHGMNSFQRLNLDFDHDEDTTRDIDLCITTGLAQLTHIDGFDDEFSLRAETTLRQKAGSNFLWIGYVMPKLLLKSTVTEVSEVLENALEGSDNPFERMLRQIDRSKWKICASILRWVALALRPLSLRALARAVKIKPQPGVKKARAILDAVTFCKPLLEVNEGVVTLIHKSAKDYLLAQNTLDEFRIDLEVSHLEIAERCIEVLEGSNLQAMSDSPRRLIIKIQQTPLLSYAITHWPAHARSSHSHAAKLCHPARLLFATNSVTDMTYKWLYAFNHRRDHIPPAQFLHMACYLGIIPFVEMAIPKGDPESTRPVDRIEAANNETFRAPLFYAIQGGHEDVVKFLISFGADVNSTYESYFEEMYTPLIHAVEDKQWKIAQILIDAGSDVDVQNDRALTPLVAAIFSRQDDLIQKIMDRGPDINPVPRKHSYLPVATPLAAAIIIRDADLIQLLIDRGARLVSSKEATLTPMSAAIKTENKALVEKILSLGEDANGDILFKRHRRRSTYLIAAAKTGNEAIVHLLLKKGANVYNHVSDNNATIEALRQGHASVARLLMDYDKRIGSKIVTLESALYYAAEHGHREVVRLLVEKGADVNCRTVSLFTILEIAVGAGHYRIAKLLLENGALMVFEGPRRLPEHEDLGLFVLRSGEDSLLEYWLSTLLFGDGYSKGSKLMLAEQAALVIAAYHGDKHIVRLLLEHGANVEAKSPIGLTALDCATGGGHQETAQLLLKHGANSNTQHALFIAAKLGRVDDVQTLLRQGVDVNSKINYVLGFDGPESMWKLHPGGYSTALAYAALFGHEEVVTILIEHGAEVNPESVYCPNALAFAVVMGYENIVRLLLEHGADINATFTGIIGFDCGDMTALETAIQMGRRDIIRLLQQHPLESAGRKGAY